MSVAFDGQSITCDRCGCTTKAWLPVALRPFLTLEDKNSSSVGWLYVTTGNDTSHFCPACGAEYLKTLAESQEEPPPTIRSLTEVAPPDFAP